MRILVFCSLLALLSCCGCQQQELLRDAEGPNRPPPRISENLGWW